MDYINMIKIKQLIITVVRLNFFTWLIVLLRTKNFINRKFIYFFKHEVKNICNMLMWKYLTLGTKLYFINTISYNNKNIITNY